MKISDPRPLGLSPSDFLTPEGDWKCIQCGACCMVAGAVFGDRGDGGCQYLTEDNLCGIYDDRPDICRTNPKTDPRVMATACWLLYLRRELRASNDR